MRRSPILLVLTLGLVSAPAHAASAQVKVEVQDGSRLIRLTDDGGVDNRLTITQDGSTIRFADSAAALKPGGRCAPDAGGQVACPVPAQGFRIEADLGGGDDEAVAKTTMSVTIDGGDGNDVLTSGDGSDDLIGGAGDDRLTGGGGLDAYDGGDGNDVIDARDGVQESVNCGAGADSGDADYEDAPAPDCESLARPLTPAGVLGAQPPSSGTPVPASGEGAIGTDGAGAPGGSALGAPEPPAPGGSVVVGVESGTVLVKAPGGTAYVPAAGFGSLPVGATIDATHGRVALTSARDLSGATQTAEFAGGAFTIVQRSGPFMQTELRLTGGDLARCQARSPSRASARAAAAAPRRRLWGSGHGRFTTRGRNAAATVRGTTWTVEDTCTATITRVLRGIVVVTDFLHHRQKVVRGGESYVARRSPARR